MPAASAAAKAVAGGVKASSVVTTKGRVATEHLHGGVTGRALGKRHHPYVSYNIHVLGWRIGMTLDMQIRAKLLQRTLGGGENRGLL